MNVPAQAENIVARRVGAVMTPDPRRIEEAGGVCNPGVARGRDGALYLFPRLVASGNYSRVGTTRVTFDETGDPTGVQRLGIAIEPEAPYELNRVTGGGCEDPRVTYVAELDRYVMTYTAYGPQGPRIALASSDDLRNWERLGLASFRNTVAPFGSVDNKDALIFPQLLADCDGRPSVAMIHRPLFPGTLPLETRCGPRPRRIDVTKESMWISFAPIVDGKFSSTFTTHRRLAAPQREWERLKIGGGAPPVQTGLGYVLVYHGVGERDGAITYSAGLMVLDAAEPSKIRYRSASPILTPEREEERIGVVPNVVFPTGLDRRTDLGQPNRLDLYYGMADRCIGVAALFVGNDIEMDSRKITPECDCV